MTGPEPPGEFPGVNARTLLIQRDEAGGHVTLAVCGPRGGIVAAVRISQETARQAAAALADPGACLSSSPPR